VRLAGLRAKEKPKSRFTFTSKAAGASLKTTEIPSNGLDSTPNPGPPSSAAASTSYTITSRSRVHLRSPVQETSLEASSSYTLILSDLDSCIVDLRSSPTSSKDSASQYTLTSLHARSLHRCILLAPLISSSALFSSITNCVIMIGAQQVRYHFVTVAKAEELVSDA